MCKKHPPDWYCRSCVGLAYSFGGAPDCSKCKLKTQPSVKKVKILTASKLDDDELEKEINIFIKDPDIYVEDIQFQESGDGHSAMIIYTEVEDNG
jgi:hypothetical protein